VERLRQNRPAGCPWNIALGDYTDLLGGGNWPLFLIREKRVVINLFFDSTPPASADGVEVPFSLY